MSKIFSTVIIEDEKPSARRLERMLSAFPLKAEAILHSVEESISWFENNMHPDLIFLDIQLSDGLSFEIFEKVKVKSAIIFTTAYDAYALKAFKLNSIDYLLKPIDSEELDYAVNKFIENKQQDNEAQINVQLIKNLLSNPSEKVYKSRYTIKVGSQLKLIDVNDIECFYSENKGTYLYTKENRSYNLDNSLEEVFKEINPDDFFKVNRKYIINIASINNMLSYSNSRLKVELENFKAEEIIVARERVKFFKDWLNK